MVLIDAKGRIFGKINVIDFMLILFLFFLMPTFYFGYRVFTKKAVPQINEMVEIEIDCNLIKINDEALELIKEGDKSLEVSDQSGEITWLGKSRPYEYIFQLDKTGHKNPVITSVPFLKMLPAKIKLKAEVRGDSLYYNGEQIFYGLPFLFQTVNYSVKAVPVEKKEKKECWVQVKVRFERLFPQLSSLVDNGHLETDEDGRIVGILKEVLNKEPSQIKVLSTRSKKLILTADPYHHDIVAVLNLLVTDNKGSLFYKNYALKVGSQISFAAKLYTVLGTIIEIKERNEEKLN